MDNQQNISGNEENKKNIRLAGGEGNEGEGTEVNPSKLNENTEVDLDRSGVNTESGNDGDKGDGKELQRTSSGAQGYESNTPDIDEETLRTGGAHKGEGNIRRQSGNNSGGMGWKQGTDRSGTQDNQEQDNSRRV
jgi:hypothetical protein